MLILNYHSSLWRVYNAIPHFECGIPLKYEGSYPLWGQTNASITMTLDTYSHVAPGIQQAAAESFDDVFSKVICREFVETPPQKAP